MLRTNLLKQKLQAGQTVYGLISSIPAAAAIELIAEAGFDFVIIDMEHVLINPETVEHMIRTAESYGLTPLVRVADLNPKTLLRLLDGGAQGIVLPMIPRTTGRGHRRLQVPPAWAAQPQCRASRRLRQAQPGAVRWRGQCTDHAGGDDRERRGRAPGRGDRRGTGPGHQQALLDSWQAAQAAGVPYCTIPRQPGDAARWQERGVRAFVLGDERGIAFRALQARLATLSAEGK